MRYIHGLALTLSIIAVSYFAYGLYHAQLLPYGYVLCISATSFQLVLLLIVWKEIDHLADFHLDRWTLIIVVLFGSILRKRAGIPYEIVFQIIQWLTSLGILMIFIRNKHKILPTKSKWFLGGMAAALVLAIAFAYLNSFYGPSLQEQSPYPVGSFVYILGKTFQQLTYFTPFEEIIHRGLLWGYFVRVGWSEKKAFWIQAIIFWLMHSPQFLLTPIPLLIIQPVATIVLSLFVLYSKQIFPALVAHTVLNVFQPIIEDLYFSN